MERHRQLRIPGSEEQTKTPSFSEYGISRDLCGRHFSPVKGAKAIPTKPVTGVESLFPGKGADVSQFQSLSRPQGTHQRGPSSTPQSSMLVDKRVSEVWSSPVQSLTHSIVPIIPRKNPAEMAGFAGPILLWGNRGSHYFPVWLKVCTSHFEAMVN